jgi:TIR domain
MRTTTIFLSYSRKDYNKLLPLFVQFQSLLKTITFGGKKHKVTFWFDQNTSPGAHWDDTIKWKLQSADVVIFFVTPNFLESEYIQSLEIPMALQRREDSKIHLIPILIDPCDYANSSIQHLQFIPNYKGYLKPQSEWKNKKEFWELARFALKISIINSLSGLPNPFYFNNEQLTAADKKKHISYFSPPEFAKLMTSKGKNKPPKKTNLLSKAKKAVRNFFKP